MRWPFVSRRRYDVERERLDEMAREVSEPRVRDAARRNVVLGRWRVVVAPRGDVIRLSAQFDEYEDGRTLMQRNSYGWFLNGQGDAVTVAGAHVALAWKEPA